jgi:ABC-type transport system involved in multi-copper enzyme maturation permease subunit
MKSIWLLAQITCKEGIRNRALLGILFFAVLLCVVNLIFTNMFAYDLGKVAVDVGLSVVSIAGLAIIFFLGINLLAKDLDKRTIYIILSRPISRWQYIVGKFFGLGLLVLISVIILGLFAAGSVKFIMSTVPNYIPPDFSWTIFFIALIYIFLSLLVVSALALLFISATSSSFLAMIITAGTYFIGQNVEIVRKMYCQAENNSGNEVSKQLVEIISWIFPNLAIFDLKTTAAYGLPVITSDLIWPVLYGISYIGLVLIIAIVIFQHRELT